jgi:hypothetical protein
VAAALIAHGIDDELAVEALEETASRAFRFSEQGLAWRGTRLSTEALAATRERARSFGSCSFREPVDELRTVTA